MTPDISGLLRRLERFAPLFHNEREALVSSMTNGRRFSAHEDLVREGKATEGVYVIIEGLGCRYKMLPDGRRQIVGYLLPGDICDLRVFLLKRMDHSIAALSSLEVALMPGEAVLRIIDSYPRLARALWWTSLVEESITREWVVNVGHRTAFERVAHLFCEIFWRLEAVGMTDDNRCPLPVTQTELADTLALSTVHVNRTLMYMRRAHLVSFQNGQLVLIDRKALEAAAGFDPSYLHLDGGNQHFVRGS
jgi:CRP-like cAMP-binding protein